jgi:hypothetical protein
LHCIEFFFFFFFESDHHNKVLKEKIPRTKKKKIS